MSATSIGTTRSRWRRRSIWRASLAAMLTSHGRSLSGSRRLASFCQAMGQAACAASWARSGSPQIRWQTRTMSSWWARTIRAKAIASPATASATVVAGIVPWVESSATMPHRCGQTAEVSQAAGGKPSPAVIEAEKRRRGSPSAPFRLGAAAPRPQRVGSADQRRDDIAPLAIEVIEGVRPVVGEELEAAFDELVVVEVVIALRVDLERRQETAAVEEHLGAVHVREGVRPAGFLRHERVDRAFDLRDVEVTVLALPV